MPKAKLSDISLYYEIYGKGAPLLLIGGLGSDSSSWLGVVKEFSSDFQVIIFDNRGCGRSDIGDKKCTIRLMADDAVKLFDHLGVERAHLVGHSMGGYIAQELAVDYPSRVDKLILVSTAPVSSKRNNLLFEDFYRQLKKEGPSEAWFKKWTIWLFSPRTMADSSFIDSFIKSVMEYPYLQKAEGFKSQIEAITSFDCRDKIGSIKAKTLTLEGKEDILITPEEARLLAKNIRGSIFHLLDGAAHAMHIENPKLFTSTVLKFIKHNK